MAMFDLNLKGEVPQIDAVLPNGRQDHPQF